MQRIYSGTKATKYLSGRWIWDNKTDSLQFEPHKDLTDTMERYIDTNGFKFLRTINPEEELIFSEHFMRSEHTFDSDSVLTSDVRDLVIFLMPKEFLTKKFLIFLHEPVVTRLFHALNIYFKYFLRLVEFVLIRRDELHGDMAQIQSEQTNEMKRIFSIYLSQYRMLVARNYSIIIKGEGSMAKFYHMNERSQISATIEDRVLHEQFLAVATQIVWISMHRRAYNVIEMEMNRLFGSEYFIANRPKYLKFTPAEKSLLYGRSNKVVDFRTQISPLIQELQDVPEVDLPILWIGDRKYRGTDTRIAALELEYIIPCAQLHLIDEPRGILGHPKRFYDTLLKLNWHKVREQHYSLDNDPYHIMRQPTLQIPKINDTEMRKMSKKYEHFLQLYHIYEPCDRKMLNKWLRRESIHSTVAAEIKLSIYNRSQQDVENTSYGADVNQIIMNYLKVVSRLRKSSTNVQDDKTNVDIKANDFQQKFRISSNSKVIN